MKEIWKPIKNFDNYLISNYGNVKSLSRTIKAPRGRTRVIPERILKPGKIHHGYCVVVLSNSQHTSTMRVHRLVAEAFLPNPNNFPMVNHKDENTSNNCVDNLEWCTAKYNTNYGTGIYRRSKSKSKPIIQLGIDNSIIKNWASAKEAAIELGLQPGNISRCCKGTRKQAYGFIWRYKEC